MGATIETWEGLDGENWAKHVCSVKHKLNIHVQQLKSITFPNICLQTPYETPDTIVVPMWKPIARSLSSMLGSSNYEEWEF